MGLAEASEALDSLSAAIKDVGVNDTVTDRLGRISPVGSHAVGAVNLDHIVSNKAPQLSGVDLSVPSGQTSGSFKVSDKWRRLTGERVATTKPVSQKFFKGLREYILKTHGIEVVVGDHGGGRTQHEQDELYAQGRTKKGPIVTKTRRSKHIHGHAIDIVADPTGKDKKSNAIVAAAMRKYAKMHSKSFKTRFLGKWDANHVEIF